MARKRKAKPAERLSLQSKPFEQLNPSPETNLDRETRELLEGRAKEPGYEKPGPKVPEEADAEETGPAERLIEGAEGNVLREQEEMAQADKSRRTPEEPKGDLPSRLRAEPEAHSRQRSSSRAKAKRRARP